MCRPTLVHVLEHPQGPVAGLSFRECGTDRVARGYVLSGVMEERDVTQTAALENAGDAALKVSGRCAGFKLSLRAAEQTRPIDLVSIQRYALSLQKMNDPGRNGTDGVCGERQGRELTPRASFSANCDPVMLSVASPSPSS